MLGSRALRRSLVAPLVVAAVISATPIAAGRETAVPPGVIPFSRSSAHVGQVISLGVGDIVTDRLIWSGRKRFRVDVYLIPLSRSPKWWPTYTGTAYASGPPPRVSGEMRLGSVLRWEGEGQLLRVAVPRVPTGRYVLGYWCRPRNVHWASALPNLQPAHSIIRIQIETGNRGG